MKVMWIGHGGLLFVSGKHKILIDPYLSDSLRSANKKLRRRARVSRKLFRIKPDAIVLTSAHPDRSDFKTIKKYASKWGKYTPTILSCEKSFETISSSWVLKKSNTIMFEKGLEWSLGDMTIVGVDAKTDDRSAFGVIIVDNEDGKKYYVASNTLYSEELIASLPTDIFCAFLPISGSFGSMNAIDAARFAKKLNAEYNIPVQYGMFDKLKADQFIVSGRVIPKLYKIIDFNCDPESLFKNDGVNFFFNEKAPKKKKAKIVEIDNDIDTVTVDIPILPLLTDGEIK